MKNLEQQFSEDLSITKPSKSVRKYSDPIPVDLLIDIFSRVPAKSIARFRCVSKFWSTILARQDFTELFLTKSSTRPRLFFTLKVNGELFIFSSPQPQNPDNNTSLVATRYKHFPKHFPNDICRSLCGLVFLRKWTRKGRVICNPVTGDFITLPKVKATGVKHSYFGYDPINKQYKVLCMTWSRYGRPNTHRILTLEAGKRLWRTIEDPVPPHYQWSNETCINGVLYYKAYIGGSYKIVCFDFRSEKFSFINIDQGMSPEYHWTLFSYKGKLGVYQPHNGFWGGYELVLWVLEGDGKHKWSKIISWRKIERGNHIVGMTDTGEIVISPYFLSNPFYLFFYNIERNTFTRVNIQGFEEFEHRRVAIDTFLDYVENMKFM